MLSTMLALLGQAPALVADAEVAYADIKAFLTSQAGHDLEAKFATLFTHTATPGAAVVVEPVAKAA